MERRTFLKITGAAAALLGLKPWEALAGTSAPPAQADYRLPQPGRLRHEMLLLAGGYGHPVELVHLEQGVKHAIYRLPSGTVKHILDHMGDRRITAQDFRVLFSTITGLQYLQFRNWQYDIRPLSHTHYEELVRMNRIWAGHYTRGGLLPGMEQVGGLITHTKGWHWA